MSEVKIQPADKSAHKPLDIKKLYSENPLTVSTKDALTNVTPIKWDDEVVSGYKNVLLVKKS